MSRYRIVVLDGYTLNPGDLSWDNLHALGECQIYDRTLPSEVRNRAIGANIVLTNKTVLCRDVIQRLPGLKYVGVLATGYNVVDTIAARERGIPVTNVPAYGTASVAQLTFALILELTHHVGHHADTVRMGRWSASPDFCYWDHPLVELHGMIFGIIGFGNIGQAVARIGQALGMTILTATHRNVPADSGVTKVDLDTLFRQSDIVSLHCPLTTENQGLINAQRLALMKPTAFLINTSRGPLVVEADLADALNSGRLAGAGVDVLSLEPPRSDNPLLQANNCLITPHFAWATYAARKRLLNTAVENVRAFLGGHPTNVING
jgi:glycerate dehydrogenase